MFYFIRKYLRAKFAIKLFQDELYAATKRFVIMKDMQVTMAKCSPSEDFDDNVMTVKYVLL